MFDEWDDGHGHARASARSGRPAAADGTGSTDTVVTFSGLPIRAPNEIPPRPWAYGNFLLFGQAAALGAVDGGGKGAMAVAMLLAMITGRDLLGEKPWRAGPVAIITYEDDCDEWQRRIAAACIYYGVDCDQVIRRVYFLTRVRGRIVFGRNEVGGSGEYDPAERDPPDEDGIIAALKTIKAVMLIVDPMNHAHAAADGNSNVEIARVAGEMTRVAREANVAVLVLHHLRKGSTGSADDLMGATALRATFRSSRILARMTTDEAKDLDITVDAWRYSRISGSKENYAPPPDRATWFKLESISLDNGTDDYPAGDNVQVTTAWHPPMIAKGLELHHLPAVFAAIRAGLEGGELFSPTRQSDAWVGKAIAEAAGKSDDEAAGVVKDWLGSGVLIEVKGKNKGRNEVRKVELNEVKAALMMTGPVGHADD